MQPLSAFLGQPVPESAPAIDFIEPLTREEITQSPKVFEQLNFVLQFCPTHPSEQDLMARFARLGIGELFHDRKIASANEPQTVIRPSQDHYNFAYAAPGKYELTKEEVGTRFAMLLFRTFVDAGDPDDTTRAHAVQDGIVIEGGGKGPFEAPNWDLEALAKARKAVNDLAGVVGLDASKAFGRKGEIDPLNHLVGIAGWAGQPAITASAFVDAVEKNDGKTPHVVTVKDVPVDAFWSITVYDADGFLAPNDLNRNSYNNTSATPNDDGSFTIHFGGDPKAKNYLPITEGWNYTIRLYQPREEILDGSWTFPAIKPSSEQ